LDRRSVIPCVHLCVVLLVLEDVSTCVDLCCLRLSFYFACASLLYPKGGAYMAVGSPTSGPSDVVLNNILRIALWLYSRRGSHPEIFLPRMRGCPDRRGLALSCRRGACSWQGRLRRACRTGRVVCGVGGMMKGAVPSSPFNAADVRCECGACGYTVHLGNSRPTMRLLPPEFGREGYGPKLPMGLHRSSREEAIVVHAKSRWALLICMRREPMCSLFL
jgi:hypothetical protein